jgi:transporter, SSS family
MEILDYVVILTYIGIVVVLGSSFFTSNKSLKDYLLGGRNIPWWAAAISGLAISTGSLLGAPGQAFKGDFTYMQYRLMLPFAILINVFIIIPTYYKLNLLSVYEYLERRFDLKTRLFASGLFIVLKCFFLGLVIYSSSLVVAEISGANILLVILLLGIIATIYTMLGGIEGVIWTDVLQMSVLLGGVIAAIWVVLSRIDGGMATVIDIASAEGKFSFINTSTSFSDEFTLWGGLFGGIFIMLALNGVDQSETQRFLTTPTLRQSQVAIATTMFTNTLYGLSVFSLGILLYVFYLQHPEKGGFGINPDRAFPKFIVEELPVGVTGLVIAAVFSAGMSSMAAVLSSQSTVVLEDYYSRLSGRPVTTRKARIGIVVFGVICTIIATQVSSLGTILVASNKLVTFFGGTLVGVFLLGMLTKRANGWGAFLGALTGFIGVILLSLLTNVSFLWYGVFSGTLAFVTGYLYSFFFSDMRTDAMKRSETEANDLEHLEDINVPEAAT